MDDFFFDELDKEINLSAELTETYLKASTAIRAQCFPKQTQVLDDPYRYKSLLTPRRCGKTHTAISYALCTALEKPGANVVIVTLTLGSAKMLYWIPILKFNDEYGLNLRRPGGIHNTHGIATFENGSIIRLIGAQTRAEIEKLRGGAYDLVIIDECKSFHPHILKELIDDIVKPALMDRRGTLLIIGTPGHVLSGPFYEATCPTFKLKGAPISRSFDDPAPWWTDKERRRYPQWSLHTFNQQHNIHCPELWEDALLEKHLKAYEDDNPTWVREYLGQWAATGDAMVYAYSRVLLADGGEADCRATYTPNDYGVKTYNRYGLDADKVWSYVLGVDMGFEDDTAIVVCAFSKHTNEMKLVFEHKEKHMLPHQVGSLIEKIDHQFKDDIEVMVADTGNMAKAIVEELNQRHDFFLHSAEKQNKYDYIELLNSDITAGLIQIPADSELAKEWTKLMWDLKNSTKRQMAKAGKLTENKGHDNHLSDAFLYAWRHCHHYFATKAPEKIDINSQRAMLAWDRKEAVKAAKRRGSNDDSDWTEEYANEELWIDASWLY